jgi:hypothetical protein
MPAPPAGKSRLDARQNLQSLQEIVMEAHWFEQAVEDRIEAVIILWPKVDI